MIAARHPRTRDATRLLVIEANSGKFWDAVVADLPRFLSEGDLVVVNDAATLPGSLRVRMPSGANAELRLAGLVNDNTWNAALFGAGDWRIPTELRDPPEPVFVGDVIHAGAELEMTVVGVSSVSTRLVTVQFNRKGPALWTALYALGKPIQYSYLEDDLALWSAQTAYAGRPWAVEMPSAGHCLSWRIIRQLRENGVGLGYLTHAAGLSSTGDEELDAALPLAERFDIPQTTAAAIKSARQTGGRIIAVGTTVVRAIEGAAQQNNGEVPAGDGVTDLLITSKFQPTVVSGILTGIHDPSQSHFRLLRAFADETTLRRSLRHASESEYLGHEFGDSCLILDKVGPEDFAFSQVHVKTLS